jgi:hypothetical protein
MTEAEILAMPAGWEMDGLIAEKVFGHQNVVWKVRTMSTTVDGFTFNGVMIPPYSTDIAAAWMVVERLRLWAGKRACAVDLRIWPSGSCSARVQIAPYATNNNGDAETMPYAICRAALLAVIRTEKPLPETEV